MMNTANFKRKMAKMILILVAMIVVVGCDGIGSLADYKPWQEVNEAKAAEEAIQAVEDEMIRSSARVIVMDDALECRVIVWENKPAAMSCDWNAWTGN
jgi:PBP1b-binding outer membrane lipoprotein LpoB